MLATPDSHVAAALGQWTEWLPVKFKAGFMQSIRGIVRFHLTSLEPFTLHASPVNFAPDAPMFPISAPWDYAGELEDAIGTYYTAGMVEDHTGLMNGRIDEHAFLAQCDIAMREREAMLQHELARFKEGFLFCLFDTPDRLQHMFWRFGEPEHPANRARFRPGDSRRSFATTTAPVTRWSVAPSPRWATTRWCSCAATTASASFQRGVHLNGWLRANGFLALKPGASGEEFFKEVDWSRTRAYALGLGGIYLNRRGREANGILDEAAAAETTREIVRGLSGLRGCGARRAGDRAGRNPGGDLLRTVHRPGAGPARLHRARLPSQLDDSARRSARSCLRGQHAAVGRRPHHGPGAGAGRAVLQRSGSGSPSLLDLAPMIVTYFGVAHAVSHPERQRGIIARSLRPSRLRATGAPMRDLLAGARVG